MKRKYGANLANETLQEQQMRERAAEAHNNHFNFGTKSAKGSLFRGKVRSKPYHARQRT